MAGKQSRWLRQIRDYDTRLLPFGRGGVAGARDALDRLIVADSLLNQAVSQKSPLTSPVVSPLV
ncbi:hypothetical protein [Thiospirillum jenense]|uniref:Uncharacterized protein n=1 Tax=Thiospirillum jenense TaxID=1653858 RepID=A0A839H7C7_9GAMM|nr:hypothetical protein [Thiospirillum jenense]MBB1125134.1 hypothetical protein [Thiospirillum jenense]